MRVYLRPVLVTLTLGLAALALAVLALRALATYQWAARGVEAPSADVADRLGLDLPGLGANVDLLNVDGAEVDRQLDIARQNGLGWLRQRVAWPAVEPEPERYEWAALDRLAAAADARQMRLILTLVETPVWARSPQDRAAPLALPADLMHYARLVEQVATRYRGRVAAIQVWDSPNLASRAVGEPIPARQYVALLRATYPAAKRVDPNIALLAGGLGPTTENSTRNHNDVRYLETLYRAGASPFFDALAAKPYGFWSGPDDRRASEDTLNFSRVVLLREIMTRYGDAAKPIWAVEWGWNSLPSGWTDRPSPWGTDEAGLQARRAADALHRARAEWPWLSVMTLMSLRPAAPPDDPVWGFALLDEALRPRPALAAVRDAALLPPPPSPRPNPLGLALPVILAAGSLLCALGSLAALWRLPWLQTVHAIDARLSRLGDGQLIALLAGVCAWFVLVPWPLNSLALPPLWMLLTHRLDLAVAAIALSAPFFLRPTRLAGLDLALVEALTLLTFASWLAREVARHWPKTGHSSPENRPLPQTLPYVGEGSRTLLSSPPTSGGPGSSPPASLSGKGEGGLGPPTNAETSPLTPLLGGKRSQPDQPSPLSSPPSLSGKGVGGLGPLLSALRAALLAQGPLNLLDLSVLLLLILGAVSPWVALYPGVANREFRVVILAPVLFYIILRGTHLDRRALLRLADALVLAGVGLAVYGFVTYPDTGGVAAEGVRRLRSLYGSPNNLALILSRILPVLLALLIWGQWRPRRLAYSLALVPILLALFLTFSTGAWLLGVPAALLALGLLHGRRALLGILTAIGVALLALLPFAGSERVARLLNLADAQTVEYRRLLWLSALNMIRDHPWLGIGLDNFLYEYRDTYILPDALADRNLSHPHNLILDFWTRLGVLAVVALVVGQVAFFRGALRLRQALSGDEAVLLSGLIASMVNFLAHGLVDNSLFLVDLAYVYMLTLGVVRSLQRRGVTL